MNHRQKVKMARKLFNDDPTAWEKDISGRHKKKGLGLFDTNAWERSKLLRKLKRKRKLEHFLAVKKQQHDQRKKLNEERKNRVNTPRV